MPRYELIGCGLHGHQLVGTDAAHLRRSDALVARDDPAGFRWYRCLRCDSWMPRERPARPTAVTPPDRDAVEVPLRGRPLRDRYVLRLIAVDRAVHALVLAALAVAIFLFTTHRSLLHHDYTRILADLQAGFGGPVNDTGPGILSELNRLFALSARELYLTGSAVAGYAVLLAVEMVGLWRARRWAEYLTLAETGLLVPFELYELSRSVSYLKLLTLIINLAVVAYLLFAHRLFGLRGGGAAAREERARDSGWQALERATPKPLRTPQEAPVPHLVDVQGGGPPRSPGGG